MYVIWAAALFVLGTAVALSYVAMRYRQILRLNGYFVKAATVYVLVGEQDAHLAALAAAEGAAEKDQARMKEFVGTLATSFRKRLERRLAPQIERGERLLKEIGTQGPFGKAGLTLRDVLKINNDAYAHGLATGDITVFIEKYPDLFGGGGTEAALNAAAGAEAPPSADGAPAEAVPTARTGAKGSNAKQSVSSP